LTVADPFIAIAFGFYAWHLVEPEKGKMQRNSDPSTPVHSREPDGQGFHVSLVIPAWNEQETIRQAMSEANAALSAHTAEYEIIIVDDGSTDRTPELVREEMATNPHVRLVQHSKNLGYGAALRTGFQAATLDLVAFTDADCQFDLNNLSYMLPLTREYGITCGYRIDRQDPIRRSVYSWGYNTLVTLLLGSRVHDIDCALKILRREHLDSILPESTNYFANAEMVSKARQCRVSVVEVGVRHRPRAAGQSKVSLWEVPKTLASLLPFWWRLQFPTQAVPALRLDARFWVSLLLVVVLAAGLLFPNLSYPLLEPDEGRYAEIAREMLISGDWVVPTLNGEPYYDKPPLLYWLVAGAFKLFGTHDWAARLVPSCAAFLTVLATFLFGRRIVGTCAAALSAVTLTLSMGFVYCGRILILDSLLSLFVTVSLLSAYRAIQDHSVRWRWWVFSAIACALGMLTKGPIALVLFAPPVVAFAWLRQPTFRPRTAHWVTYLVLVFIVAAPWYAAMIAREPTFAYRFFWQHHVERFLSGANHPEPIWFYGPVLLISCSPWSFLFLPVATVLFSRASAEHSSRREPLGYFVLWAGWCVGFFSLASGKLPPYVLPALPAVTLLFGWYLDQVLFQKSLVVRSVLARNAVAIMSVGMIAVHVGSYWLRLQSLEEVVIESVLWAAILMGALLLGSRLSSKMAWLLCSGMTLLVIVESAHELIPAWAATRSPLAQCKEVSELLRDEHIAVACCGTEWGSVPFYLGRANVRKFSTPPTQDLTNFLDAHPRTLLIVKRANELESFDGTLPPGMELIRIGTNLRATVALVQPIASGRPTARVIPTVKDEQLIR
jgi:4-amino-4-deoxy-L-arabinose transferase-like glycosyltransferase